MERNVESQSSYLKCIELKIHLNLEFRPGLCLDNCIFFTFYFSRFVIDRNCLQLYSNFKVQ